MEIMTVKIFICRFAGSFRDVDHFAPDHVMQDSASVSTPIATDSKLMKSKEESTVDQKQYQSNVGS